MPPEGQDQQTNNSSVDDKLASFQKELTQKTSSLDEKLASINQTLSNMNQQQASLHQQTSQNKKPDPILNPDEYEAYMEQRMEQKINQRMSIQQKQNNEIAGLASQYPELSDGSSELTKAALQSYNQLSNEEKASPLAYRAAVQAAALELGLLPQNKRKQQKQVMDETEDFGGTNSNQNSRPQNNSKKGGKVDAATLAFAQALGKNVNDPEYLKRLEKASGRGSWGKFKNKGDY